jgi:hypothetical protein
VVNLLVLLHHQLLNILLSLAVVVEHPKLAAALVDTELQVDLPLLLERLLRLPLVVAVRQLPKGRILYFQRLRQPEAGTLQTQGGRAKLVVLVVVLVLPLQPEVLATKGFILHQKVIMVGSAVIHLLMPQQVVAVPEVLEEMPLLVISVELAALELHLLFQVPA